MNQPGAAYVLEVNPRIPERLARLEELANDLRYSWDRATRSLFARLNPMLWAVVGHSPKAFLKRVDERRLVEAAEDPEYLISYNRVLSVYDSYHEEPARRGPSLWLGEGDLVAYFCAEFGFHESLPIYSGGLGILAGDHCKAASDMRLPFVGVGLLYREGYFAQIIDGEGSQHATYADSDFEDLPVTPVLRPDGSEVRVEVDLPGRTAVAKLWQARIGHVRLYLLDTDLPENSERDRGITHRLYGGDRHARIAQEIVLGIGGVRALAALGISPTVWHINEGHAAFLVLERMRALVLQGLDFASALEAVSANTVFTTHTSVSAGHDHFTEEMIAEYFDAYCGDLGIERQELSKLGRDPASHDFNMTALAVRGSRFQNGVSRIHGGVSARMLQALWPQIPPEENPITFVTNGVHVPTFLSPDWSDVFDRFLGFGWTQRFEDPACWARIAELPDHILWSTHQYLKSQMLHMVRYRIANQHYRNGGSEAHLDRLLRLADPTNPNVLTIGFGRRFATYKRATLLFENLDWLREIVLDAQRPVLFIFAGKAHPADVPGQDLIRQLSRVARTPEFEGRILLVEDYDLRLARRLVSGVDVWMNNPIYPLEASGTSGMKAGVNGVINLSVLDGWWEEGYQGNNGWAIKPASEALEQHRRNSEEARTLYEILQDQVIPMYYNRGNTGYSSEWVGMAKRSIASLMPRVDARRMLGEYRAKCYFPASQQGRRYHEGDFEGARAVAQWKARVRAAWPGVAARRLDAQKRRIHFGEDVRIEIAVKLNGLAPEDIMGELLLSNAEGFQGEQEPERRAFASEAAIGDTGEHRFVLNLTPESCGRLGYRIRIYPCHELLAHPFEMGLMVWI
ncbi:MAG: alpha-glucan family phosphorylase [Betaproteobacteria bacterium]|nr:alpha-glucan family phosphorylase [Betaproteobacteria bacterium]